MHIGTIIVLPLFALFNGIPLADRLIKIEKKFSKSDSLPVTKRKSLLIELEEKFHRC